MEATLIKLTDENYFSQEANQQYMSVSQFKAFGGCEAAALASLSGEWKEEESTALLVGSYFHSHFEGTLDKFKKEHPQIFTAKGELKANYRQANEMINCLEMDENFKQIYVGEKEKIFTGKLFDADWKIKVDCLNVKDGYFVDLKTTRDFEKQWIEKEGRNTKVSFVEKWKYLIQIAVYKEILRQNTGINDLEGFIIAVTKQDPPDKIILYFKPEDYEIGMNQVRENIERVMQVKNGLEKPMRCERCAYCRATKKLDRAFHYTEL
ncbi:PD-(D/E)XK nuclease-like domain-containing protein [Clostridium kluyveri]|uniref:Putative exodeoxyribonuclease 8 PDDEXK-like domain-containing protein n=1 Tax=Clostridium kluyveri TaxID=1534 RepID=A0A1L5F8S0_CLOKL|nr:PD-(D/E)XK nuclease-like domain-containing protein [Clostridium kluyveri]APM39426.1 hypothetical protein BS101_12070 [Clostridium kluyveri]